MTRKITLLLLLAAGAYAQNQTPTDWRFAHPDAGVRASINVQSLLKSPMIASLKDQAPKENQLQIGMALTMLSSIDRISLSMAGPAQKTADPAADPDMLIEVNGGFDASFLKAMLPDTGTTQVKQVDPHTLLIGSKTDSFAGAVQRLAGGSRPVPADELETNDLWMWADLKLLNQLPSTDIQFDGLKSFSFGINAGEKPELNLIANATDADGAKKLLETFNLFMKQGGMPADTAAMVAKALDLRADGSKLRVRFTPPPEMIKAAQDQASSASAGGASSALQPLLGILGLGGNASPAPSAAKPEAPPSNGGNIVITGLDDGPRVIAPK